MRRYLEKRNAAHTEEWRCRIGINSGPIIGSIVGVQKYVYDIFGPGVNLAARLEAYAEPMRIVMSEDTYEMIKDDFICTELGEVDILFLIHDLEVLPLLLGHLIHDLLEFEGMD